MKRVLLLLLVLGSVSLSAQDSQKRFRHHEFSSSFSVGSNPADKTVQDVTSQYIDAYQMEVANGCFNIFGASHLMLNFEYHYRLNQTSALGFIFGWGVSSNDYEGCLKSDNRDDLYLVSNGSESSRIFHIAPSYRYSWYRFSNNKCSLYSRLAVGAMRQHMQYKFGAKESEYADHSTPIDNMAVSYDQVKWKATYQITAVGFDAGLGSFHVYDELGYGCQGVWVVCGCRVVF